MLYISIVGRLQSYVHTNSFDATSFLFPAKSSIESDGIITFVVTTSVDDTVVGVSVAVYSVPEPDMFVIVAFVILKFDVAKDTNSLEKVNVRDKLVVLLEMPESIVLEIVHVGNTGSYVHENVFDALVF